MSVSSTTALVVTALLASIYLLTHRGDRLAPGVAVLASGLQALLAFKLVQLSITRVRIDLALAALLLVAGAICWSRSSAKAAVAASTAVVLIALFQVLTAIDVLR